MSKLLCGVLAALLFTACVRHHARRVGSTYSSGKRRRRGEDPVAQHDGRCQLTGLATTLDAFDPLTMNAAEFQVAAGAVAAALAQLQATGDQAILRDAAITAIQSVQGGTVDKNTATQAAVAIRALASAIC